ncbi:hypothetical protein ACFPPD_21730 [Cohnella suwonensis]|uniref:Uncharacterized protein n=1 Tax=Cohnella suwonensis TaxID=696072 RepID=A0ABW0M2F4_9BACL
MIDKVIRIFNIINAIQANPGISASDGNRIPFYGQVLPLSA